MIIDAEYKTSVILTPILRAQIADGSLFSQWRVLVNKRRSLLEMSRRGRMLTRKDEKMLQCQVQLVQYWSNWIRDSRCCCISLVNWSSGVVWC